MKLVLTEAALDDLRSIRAYTLEKWGAGQEKRYLQQIWSCFEAIRGEPGRYRLNIFQDTHKFSCFLVLQ